MIGDILYYMENDAMDYCIAVFDVGKTNKKLLMYDSDLQLVDTSYTRIDEYAEGGTLFEDTGTIFEWFKKELRTKFAQFPVRTISVTTHGATFACLDRKGQLAVPVVSYTTDPGQTFHDDFFSEFGKASELQMETATPDFGNLINAGKSLYYIKTKFPDRFRRISRILYYPQYFGYLLTGNYGAEPTSMGCHTYLWDFLKQGPSSVAERLGIARKLPSEIKSPWSVLGTVTKEIARETGIEERTVVTMGIHDSNSSLLPYLIQSEDDFMLDSTGTWCVTMHPEDSVAFGDNELRKLVFYNLSAFNTPVKTAIFMGGQEFETYTDLLKTICGEQEFPQFDIELYRKIVHEKKLFIIPSVVPHTGLFPFSAPRVVEDGTEYVLENIQSGKKVPGFFRDFRTAYAVLTLSLGIQTRAAFNLTGMKKGIPVFIEGGFARNGSYAAVLTGIYPDSEIATTNLNEATAFGAALLGRAAVEGTDPRELGRFFPIERTPVTPVCLDGIEDYIARFIEYV